MFPAEQIPALEELQMLPAEQIWAATQEVLKKIPVKQILQQKDGEEQTALHKAASACAVGLVDLLKIEIKDNTDWVMKQDDAGRTALHMAVFSPYGSDNLCSKTVQALRAMIPKEMQVEAVVRTKDNEEASPLHYAALSHRREENATKLVQAMLVDLPPEIPGEEVKVVLKRAMGSKGYGEVMKKILEKIRDNDSVIEELVNMQAGGRTLLQTAVHKHDRYEQDKVELEKMKERFPDLDSEFEEQVEEKEKKAKGMVEAWKALVDKQPSALETTALQNLCNTPEDCETCRGWVAEQLAWLRAIELPDGVQLPECLPGQ